MDDQQIRDFLERVLAHERELREQWQKAHQQLHAFEKTALRLARDEIARRLEEMNLLRRQIERERGTFVQRELYDKEVGALKEASGGIKMIWLGLLGLAGVAGAVIVIINFIRR